MGHAAMLVNEGLPNYLIAQLRPSGLAQKSVAILGMAFKGDSDDVRDSLSYKLRKLLEVEAREVLCTDPYVQDPRLVPLDDALARADIIILGAPPLRLQVTGLPAGKADCGCLGFLDPVEGYRRHWIRAGIAMILVLSLRPVISRR